MTDIDFDELDRAVTGALGKSPASNRRNRNSIVEREDSNALVTSQEQVDKPESEAVVQTATIEEVPAVEEVETPQEPIYKTVPTPRPSSGRFMDMVHPSSDMRSKSAETLPGRSPVPEPPVASLSPTPVFETTDEDTWKEPLESPFLPDAKVKKRPLGGLASAPKDEMLEAPDPQELLEANSMPDPIDFVAAQAVTEDMEAQFIESEEETSTRPETVSLQEAPLSFEQAKEAAPVVETEPVPAPIVEEPIGPTSITPQYKEQPSSKQESGVMYDTESYHQPITVPIVKKKKSSSVMTIVWILLLVALGAAVGWAVYTYVLPRL